MSQSQYPAHADPRSHKLFHRVYVGPTQHGKLRYGGCPVDVNGYTMSFDNRDKSLKSTAMLGNRQICVYCGHQTFSRQPHIDDMIPDYRVVGYTCICKGAMDELEYLDSKEQMEIRHRQELAALEKSKPKESMDVKKRFIENYLNNLEEYQYDRVIEKLGI